MARKKSKTEDKTAAVKDEMEAEAVEDAVVTEEVLAETSDVSEDEAVDSEPAAEIVEDDRPEPEYASVEEEPVETPPVPQPEPVRIVERKGGFVPMVLGGLVAGGLGYGAATYLEPEADLAPLTELTQKLDAQAEEISALRGELAKYDDSAAIANTQSAVSEMSADVATVKEGLAKVDGFDGRISALEKAPLAATSPEAVAAYEKELEAFRKSLEEQRAEVEAIAASAEMKRAVAEASAESALKRSALSEIQTSLETGSPFANAVRVLEETGVSVPDAVKAVAAEGVQSVTALTEGFAPVAREALAAARKEDGASGGFSDFLKSQLGARSIAPREGTDPDAVLSRMEAAAKAGQFDVALTEAAALSDAAKAPLLGWLEAARKRTVAVDAAAALSQDINSN